MRDGLVCRILRTCGDFLRNGRSMASTTRDASADAENIVNVVIGTAGHIDHGKSLLVRRLTGIDPDRLKEEQERGITIDLGFAPMVLADGTRPSSSSRHASPRDHQSRNKVSDQR